MGYALKIELPGLTRLNTASSGGHWRNRKREKDRVFGDVGWLTAGKRPTQPLDRARVRITRRSSATRSPDFENLCQGGKGILDALIHHRIIHDDNPDVIGRPDYEWERVKPKQGSIVVEVWDMDAWAKERRSA